MAALSPQQAYPKQLWRSATKQRFVPLKAKFGYRGGVRSKGRVVWPTPHWLPKYLAALYRREKRTNWLAIRDMSRRIDKRLAEGRKITALHPLGNFWGFPYS